MKNARNKYEKLPEEEKEVKREYGKNRYKKNEKTKQNKQTKKQTGWNIHFLHNIKWAKRH